MSEEPEKATMPLLNANTAQQDEMAVPASLLGTSADDSTAQVEGRIAQSRPMTLAPMSPGAMTATRSTITPTLSQGQTPADPGQQVTQIQDQDAQTAHSATDALTMREHQVKASAMTPASAGSSISPRSRSVREREADGYAHACQAVFAGYIAVAHRQNLEPTVQGFWSTPQRDMVLPSLEILAQLLVPLVHTNEMQGADLLDVASGAYAAEKAALRSVLTRKDNRYTRPCTPLPASPPQPALASSASHATPGLDSSGLSQASVPAQDLITPDLAAAVKIAIRSSADRATQDQIRWRLTPVGRDLFRPMVKTSPTPLDAAKAGHLGVIGDGGVMSPYVSPSGLGGLGHGVVGTPSWWNL